MKLEERLMLAEAIRQACVVAAVEAAEDAGVRGLCAEGRLEAAMAAIRQLDVRAVVRACSTAQWPEHAIDDELV
jgi:hypothetical protein